MARGACASMKGFESAFTSTLVGLDVNGGQRVSDQANSYMHRYSPTDIRWLSRSSEVNFATSRMGRLE